MRRTTIAVILFALALDAPSAPAASVTVEPISFQVTNPLDPGQTLTVNGHIYLPPGEPECNTSAMLLVHGLSYGEWAWDFPLEPETYSTARALAARGYPAVAIDLPGYGSSTQPNGYTLTVQSYAVMVDQIAQTLRAEHGFGSVGLMGHSAGAEISELAAGLFGTGDVVIPTAYSHFPSDRIVTEFVTGDMVRAAQDDYEYFGGTEDNRAEYMYNLDVADPDVVALDTQLANLTPSGQIFSIGPQPSRFTMGLIDVPVLLVLAEEDVLFPSEYAELELMLFASSPDASLYVVPQAGHSFMLHPNAPDTNEVVADWLDGQPAISAC